MMLCEYAKKLCESTDNAIGVIIGDPHVIKFR